MVRVVIVGGGISGLSCGWFLSRIAPPDLDLELRIVEPSDALGGKVSGELAGGVVREWGPHGILDDEPDTRTLLDDLLPGRRLESRRAARRRMIVHRGRLAAAPSSPLGVFTTPLLSPRGRARVLREALVKPAPGGDAEESVDAFARRRFGDEAADAFFDPFVTGVYAGDPKRLSVRDAFPKLAALERDHGSVLRGMIARQRARRRAGESAPTLISFPHGMAELPAAIAGALGRERVVHGEATRLERAGSGYLVEVDGAGSGTLSADVLVLAVPAPVAKRLAAGLDEDLASNLGLIPHADLDVVCLAYDRRQVGGDTEAFGFLCPAREKRRVLGCIYSSSIFEGHAPADVTSLRVLLGGVRQRLSGADDAALIELATGEVAELLDVRGEPASAVVRRHPGAIAQYTLGHRHRLAAIDGRLRFQPSLFLAGASYRGVGVNDCVRGGRELAQSVVRFLLSDDRGTPGPLAGPPPDEP